MHGRPTRLPPRQGPVTTKEGQIATGPAVGTSNGHGTRIPVPSSLSLPNGGQWFSKQIQEGFSMKRTIGLLASSLLLASLMLNAQSPEPAFNGLDMNLGNLSQLSHAQTRSITAENPTGEKGKGGVATEGTNARAARDLGQGWKVSPSIEIQPGRSSPWRKFRGPEPSSTFGWRPGGLGASPFCACIGMVRANLRWKFRWAISLPTAGEPMRPSIPCPCV